MASIEDLIAAYTLGSVSGLDTGTGKRDVDLKDPNVYTDTEIEDAPLPDDLKYVTRGKGLKKKEYVGNKGRDELNFLQKIGLGIVDAVTDNKFDWDRADLIPKDEYNAKRLAERKRKADLSGRPTLTKQEAIDSLPGKEVLYNFEIEKMKQQRDDQLKYLLAAYPQLADMINDEIYKQRMRIELNSPSEILGRINKSRTNYVDAVRGRAEAQERIANATAMGLGRYSGIRNVAG